MPIMRGLTEPSVSGTTRLHRSWVEMPWEWSATVLASVWAASHKPDQAIHAPKRPVPGLQTSRFGYSACGVKLCAGLAQRSSAS